VWLGAELAGPNLRIAYIISRRQGSANFWLMRADGWDKNWITQSGNATARPSRSPDLQVAPLHRRQ
jgi:Tol biopolymer transport system component